MTVSKTLTVQMNGEIAVLTSPAYFDQETGTEAHRLVAEQFRQGCRRFVIDFGPCKVANSPGIALLMDLAIKVLDDYHGLLVLCAVDPDKEAIFSLIGVIPLASLARTLPEALQEAARA